MGSVHRRIREVLAVHGQLVDSLESLGDDDDLYKAGMTSHASVSVMLALENEFDVEFPDSELRRSSFESVAAISQVLAKVGVDETT